MAKAEPLVTVLKLIREAEEQAALQLRSAQMTLNKQQDQQTALENYRLDYMKQIQSQQGKNISASAYHQFHQFIRQIDAAISQQVIAVNDSIKQFNNKQAHWLEKQQKRKAIEQLLEKKAQKAASLSSKIEQKQSDEFAAQQFYRNKKR